ncbi:exonuclease domain-containing protein [Flavobacteriaceae bacterium]|nr:exonuclease domain-containing protein [Flavobacteriaceae bacterium]MDB4601831.1 exonuclease domain-containing protein [Flavobacteriaceae bacterium]MDC0554273.1 exonuclease domain-containing protein [Flavobacteriaceae bacterium]MDC3227707.1 exonuclease domain-containing protein [Flavobacteriaceae bacterium]
MYSILDVETTGGKFNEEGITEIAIYRFDGEKIVDQFVSLINPEIPIQPFVQQLTGINDKMLINAPKFYQIAKRILEITENSILVAHNSSFDYRMLKIEFERLGYKFYISQLCTVKLSKKIIPDLKSYKLGNLVKNLGIPISNRHRASGDALATVELFKLLLLKDNEKVIVNSLITETKPSSKNKWQKLINKLPNDVGIYYFHDQNGKIIYIGKSNNIKNRVNQHLTGKSKKSLNIQLEAFDITFERTGSELIALLKENTEIKKHKPKFNKLLKKIIKKFCLEICENLDGDKYLRICHYDDTVNYLECYSSLKTANSRLEFFKKKYELSDSIKKNNTNINLLIKDLSYKFKNMLLIDKGRDIDEKSVIVVKNNNYIGYGFFTLNHQISNFEVLDSLIVKNEYIENSKEVILKYLKKHKIEKLINFD